MYHAISIAIAVAAVALFVSPVISAMVETFASVNAALTL